ncbi:MAG: flagellar motor switch protein FliM [Acidobacteria bacterium]|nr:flagellar motor switch protein FliM [Acidobacteriota bacterium]
MTPTGDRRDSTAPGAGTPALTDATGKPAEIFDFSQLQRLPEDHLGTIGDLHETFLRSVGPVLAMLLRCSVHAEVTELEDATFGRFLDELASPTCVAFLAAPPSDIPCALEIPSGLVSTMLDLLMGGDGRDAGTQGRELTVLEKDLLETVLAVVTHELSEAWRPFLDVRFSHLAIRTNPRTADLVSRSEGMAVVGMKLTVGETEGVLHLAIPASLAKRVRQETTLPLSSQPEQPAGMEEAIQLRLSRELLLDVDFELRDSAMRLADLIGLNPGSVLDLGTPCDGAITVSVNGVPRLRGVLTQGDARMAVTIE